MYKQRFYKLVDKRVISISLEEMITREEPVFTPIKRTEIGSYSVNTVFLGIDHSFGGRVPLLFETAILNKYGIEIIGRTSTYNDALEMHNKTVIQGLSKSPFLYKLKYKINKYLNSE